MMSSELFKPIRKNPLLLRNLVIDKKLYSNYGEIVQNCKKLHHLKIGLSVCKFISTGSIWDGELSINDDLEETEASSDDDEGDESDNMLELDIKLIASNLHKLKSLHIDSGVQLKRQPVAPPLLDQLTQLEELRLCPIKHGICCDTSRDEWNLRVLAQSSMELKKLDLRGCYLKIFSLGWLKTKKLESLHIYYQVPAASVLSQWSSTLKCLTLAKISALYRRYRSLGPDKPGDELDACLISLASAENSQLAQLDLHESDCSLVPLQQLVKSCRLLSYIDTRGCEQLPQNFRVRISRRSEISNVFTV